MHVHTWNKALIITLNGPLYKTGGGNFSRYIFHVYQPRIAFHDQTGVFGAPSRTVGPGWNWLLNPILPQTLCALNKGGEQGEKCTPWRHWIWTLFWLRAVGTEADEVVKISQIMRQGDKQVPDWNDSSLSLPPHHRLDTLLQCEFTTPITQHDWCAQWRQDRMHVALGTFLGSEFSCPIMCAADAGFSADMSFAEPECVAVRTSHAWVKAENHFFLIAVGQLPCATGSRLRHILWGNCRSNFCKVGNY